MFKVFMNQFALWTFKEALRTGDRQKAMLAWELMHLDAVLGDAYIPNPDDPDPGPWPFPGPWPWPWIKDGAGPIDVINPVISAELIRIAGDPSPQTSIFADKELRAEAAKSVISKLRQGIAELEKISGV